MAESAFPQVSDSGGPKLPRSCKKLAVKRVSKSIKKLEKTECQRKDIPSPGKIKTKITVLSNAALATNASNGVSSIHDVTVVNVIDDGALKIPPSVSLCQDVSSGL